EIARTTVARFVGIDRVDVVSARLLELPLERPVAPVDPAMHPVAMEQSAAIEQPRAQLRELERSYVPRFHLQGAADPRGRGRAPRSSNRPRAIRPGWRASIRSRKRSGCSHRRRSTMRWLV